MAESVIRALRKRKLVKITLITVGKVFEERLRAALVAAIKLLPEREQHIMGMYYEHDMNLKEIAAVLGVTESRVCQLHSQAIARLRTKMRAH